MGARTNFTFKTQQGTLTLYSHWGGDTKFRDLAHALDNAMPRIEMGDTSYALRITISQLIGDAWDEETGYGLFIGSEGGEESYEPVLVDFTNNTVTHNNATVSIQTFINYYSLPDFSPFVATSSA